MKTLIETVLQSIVDNGYTFQLECGGDILTPSTTNVDKGFKSDGNPYQGIHAVDDCYIMILKDETKEEKVYGWIRWTNCNSGVEKVVDYSFATKCRLNFDKVLEQWDKNLQAFINTF